MSAKRKLIAAIHVEAKNRGVEDDDRRALMLQTVGKDSCAKMSDGELGRVLDAIKGGRSAEAPPLPRNAYGGKLRALWISGYWLGVFRERSDKALAAFIKRQTGLDAARFLHAPEDAEKAIEALKDWLHREAGVNWESFQVNYGGETRAEQDPRARVIYAQWRRLGELGELSNPSPHGLDFWASKVCGQGIRGIRHLEEKQKDQVIRSLGAKLRKALKC